MLSASSGYSNKYVINWRRFKSQPLTRTPGPKSFIEMLNEPLNLLTEQIDRHPLTVH